MEEEGVIPKLLTWYEINHRILPWRETKNPYEIWVSEMILQQTRVDQGLPYYKRFLDKFPQITDLAAAKETEVLAVWQGLGYYARARNMYKAAKIICNEKSGEFPSTFGEIKRLPGIGPYTAAAIASFAFKEMVPCVDGNVKRVVARWQGWSDDIGTVRFFNLAFDYLKTVIPQAAPDTFNQAMMELGSLVCTPYSPNCMICPLMEECEAARLGMQSELPVKIKKTKVSKVQIHYLLLRNLDGEVAFTQRPSNGVWGGLYELPSVEFPESKNNTKLVNSFFENLGIKTKILIATESHLLSHKKIEAFLWKVSYISVLERIGLKIQWARKEQIKSFPKHKLMLKFVPYWDDKSS
jgi:A/G-specific adenine glycosylase